MAREIRPTSDRFYEKIMADPNSGCWLWTGSLDRHGYGQLSCLGSHRPHRAHRLSYELHYGPIGRACVLHKCDTPACVNPQHLTLGTQTENLADMRAKGRWKATPSYGEKHGMSKLTADAVTHIRRREMSQQKYADMYGVCRTAVSAVMRGLTWRK